MEKGISYLNRTFEDYKDALIEFSKKYYPDLATSYDDASVAAWQIDVAADVADNLSYHIDRVFQETNIESAQERASLYSIARNNGVKIPGPKGAMAEMRITFVLPVAGDNGDEPDYSVAPIVKRGTKFASSSQFFELLTDVDFKSQFNEEGVSDRTIVPTVNSNGIITGYTVSKLAVVSAGETRVYRQVVHQSDIEPFMEIIMPIEGIMNVESILVVDGVSGDMMPPSYGEFYSDGCSGTSGVSKTRFYEVDSLAQNWAWLDVENNGKPVRYKYGYDANGVASSNITYCITRGEWRPVQNKFITEYTDNGYLKIIFGPGVGNVLGLQGSTMHDFSKWQMSRILNNHNLGKLPNPESTIFILYRIGGGKTSNVAKGAINKVAVLNAEFRGDQETASKVYKSLKVENTTPSVSGKDMPSERELKYLIKYNRASQERCVTVKDYIDRILRLPPKYGTPFRVGVMEENNKIKVYLLGLDYQGKLDDSLPTALVKNIEDYLAGYRMINDYVEIKCGKIINLSFDVNVIVDKNYNKSDIISDIIHKISDYMDINKMFMGEEIYVSDIEKEISKIDGVINLISLNVYNEHGSGYSSTQIEQEIISSNNLDENNPYLGGGDADLIDLEATDGIIYSDGDCMMEVKYPEVDIRVRIKEK